MTARAEPAVHVDGLDGVRALAAYGVIATHVGFNTGRSLDHGPFAPFLSRLDFGVTLFFLLSGFLLFRPFAAAAIFGRPAPKTRSFWWRRALRILPAYWIAVTVTLAFLTTRQANGSDWSSYLLMIQTYNSHDVDSSLFQMWTLVVEVSFYALLPVLAALPRVLPAALTPVRRQLVLLVCLVAVALVGDIVGHQGGPSPSLLWLPSYLDWFGLGMFLAVASCVSPAHARWRRVLGEWAGVPEWCWIAGALVFWLATLPLAGPYNLLPATTWEWTLKHGLYGLAAFFFLLPLMLGSERSWPQHLLGNRLARRLGEVSYGIYLWHLPLLILIQRRMHWPVFGGHFVALFVLTSVTATLAASLSYYLIERPLLRRFSRPWRRGGKESTPESRKSDQAEDLDTDAAGQRVG